MEDVALLVVGSLNNVLKPFLSQIAKSFYQIRAFTVKDLAVQEPGGLKVELEGLGPRDHWRFFLRELEILISLTNKELTEALRQEE